MNGYVLSGGEAVCQVTACEVTRQDGTVEMRLSLATAPDRARTIRLPLPEPVSLTAGERLTVWVDQLPEVSAYSALCPYVMSADSEVTSIWLWPDENMPRSLL